MLSKSWLMIISWYDSLRMNRKWLGWIYSVCFLFPSGSLATELTAEIVYPHSKSPMADLILESPKVTFGHEKEPYYTAELRGKFSRKDWNLISGSDQLSKPDKKGEVYTFFVPLTGVQ